MACRSKTGFDKFFNKQMESPSVARAYRESRTKINAVDEIVRSLDQARLTLGMSKGRTCHGDLRQARDRTPPIYDE